MSGREVGNREYGVLVATQSRWLQERSVRVCPVWLTGEAHVDGHWVFGDLTKRSLHGAGDSQVTGESGGADWGEFRQFRSFSVSEKREMGSGWWGMWVEEVSVNLSKHRVPGEWSSKGRRWWCLAVLGKPCGPVQLDLTKHFSSLDTDLPPSLSVSLSPTYHLLAAHGTNVLRGIHWETLL